MNNEAGNEARLIALRGMTSYDPADQKAERLRLAAQEDAQAANYALLHEMAVANAARFRAEAAAI